MVGSWQGLQALQGGLEGWASRTQQNQQFQQSLMADEQRMKQQMAFQRSQIRSQREYDEEERELARKREHLALIDVGVMHGMDETFLRSQKPEALGIMAEMYMPGYIASQQAQREREKLELEQQESLDALYERGILDESYTAGEWNTIQGTPYAPMTPQQQQALDLQMLMGEAELAYTEARTEALLNPPAPRYGGGGTTTPEYSITDVAPEDYYRIAASLGGVYTDPTPDDPETPWVDEEVEGGWERPYGLSSTQFNKEILDAYVKEHESGIGGEAISSAFDEAVQQYMDWGMGLIGEPFWWADLTDAKKDEINEAAMLAEPV